MLGNQEWLRFLDFFARCPCFSVFPFRRQPKGWTPNRPSQAEAEFLFYQ